MVFLPVVERELRVAARGRAIYRVRFYAALLLIGLFAWYVENSAQGYRTQSQMGHGVMELLITCAFVFFLFVGVLATSDCVSSEKREGTLGLLFLTDLKGYDVIFGKLAANSLTALYGLLAILPVLGLPVLMGGITPAQFLRFALTLFSTMFYSLAIGIFVSTQSRNERKAMFFTFVCILVMAGLPLFLPLWYDSQVHSIPANVAWWFLMFTPAYGIGETLSPSTAFPAWAFWFSIIWQWLVAVALLARACRQVPHSWDESAAAKKPRAKKAEKADAGISRTAEGRRRLERNPFFWLALQGDEASPGRVWLFVISLLVIFWVAAARYGVKVMADAQIALLVVYMVHVPLKIWIASEAARRFSEDRSNQTFETLLSTPLPPRQIILGQWMALVRQFAAPIGAVLALDIVLMLLGLPRNSSWQQSGQASGPMDYWPNMVLLVTDGLALGWVGMWLGLVCKGRIRAILGSLTLVLLFRWIITLAILSRFSNRMGSIVFSNAFSTGAWKTFQMVAHLFPGLALDAAAIILLSAYLPKNFRRLAVRR